MWFKEWGEGERKNAKEGKGEGGEREGVSEGGIKKRERERKIGKGREIMR